MNINVTYDSSVSTAPAGFTAAVSYVVNLFDSIFTSAVTINIDVGWNEIDGSPMGAGDLGESLEAAAPAYSYSTVVNAFKAVATASGDASQVAAVATLPATDPTGGGTFDIGTADAKALGLIAANSTAVDGWVGFGGSFTDWSFAPGAAAPADGFNIIGTIEHEFTEVMGRNSILGGDYNYSNGYSLMDMFRYITPGTINVTSGGTGSTAYFSIDGGKTSLGIWNNDPNNGDLGDWYPEGPGPGGNDSFTDYGNYGALDPFTTADVTLMNVLGWDTSTAPTQIPNGVTGWVAPSVTSSGIVVLSGSVLDVGDAGSANGTMVSSGGTESVFFGGTASGTVVDSGGTLVLMGGAIASGTTLSPGATLEIAAGYVMNGATVTSGFTLEVASGGIASADTISSGGVLKLLGGALVSGNAMRPGAVLEIGGGFVGQVSSGVSSSGVVVLSGGALQVSSGGTVSATVVSSGGTLELFGGAVANGTALAAGGTLEIGAGDSVSGLTVNSGMVLEVGSGGTASATIVSSGGALELLGGSIVSGTTLASGGILEIASGFLDSVSSGQTSSGIVVLSGGVLTVSAGATVVSTLDGGGRVTVRSGGAASATTVGGGGVLELLGGAVASGTVLSSGGTLEIGSGYTDNGFGISSGIILAVESGGTASGTTVSSGGTIELLGGSYSATIQAGGAEEIGLGYTISGFSVASAITLVVASGGTASATTVHNGGTIKLLGGAVASGTTLRAGAALEIGSAYALSNYSVGSGILVVVVSGGTALATTVSPNGEQDIYGGGIASGTAISNGYEEVYVGARAISSIVDSNGEQDVDGTASGTVVSSAGFQYVSAGGTDSGATVLGGGFQAVYGTAFGTTVASGGNEQVSAGGLASGTILSGTLELFEQATAVSAVILSGGAETVLSDGVDDGATVGSGGLLKVLSGGTANATSVASGGGVTVSSGGTANATSVASGGGVQVQDGGTLAGNVVDNGTVSFDITGNTRFSGTLTGSGTLVVSGGGALDVVSAYSGAAQIDDTSTMEFAGPYAGAATFSGSSTGSGGTLKFDAGSTGPITVVNPNDTVIAQPGSDNWIDAAVSYTLPTNIDTLFLFAGAQGAGNSDAAGDALYALDTVNTQTLTGNSPNDAFAVYSSSDVVVPKAGSHDVVFAAASYTLPAGVDALFLEDTAAQGTGNSDAAGDALYATNPGQVATLTGNSANDVFVVYDSADVVVPKAGSHDLVYSAVNYTLPVGVDVLFLEAGTHGAGNSDAAGDALYAADAGIAQTLTGNSGNDAFVVYNSSDVVAPKSGSHDTVYAAVNYTLPTGVDTLFLEAGTQGAGNSDAAGDVLYAADTGIGQTLTGHSHNDSFVVYNSADTVAGQAGSTDTVYAAANFTLPTNVDTLFLEGNASHGTGNGDANNLLYGNAGIASTLVAGSGADTLYITGTAGTIMTGGAGHDTFAFPNAMGHDEVTDFGTPKDTLQFNATLFANFTAAMSHASQVGANTVFTIDANNTVTLDNVVKTSLTASNFHFG